MKSLTSISLLSIALASCSLNTANPDTKLAITNHSESIKAQKIATLSDNILYPDNSPDKPADLDSLVTQISQLSGEPMTNSEYIDYIKTAKKIKSSSTTAHKVAHTLEQDYADGEYAWVSKVLTHSH